MTFKNKKHADRFYAALSEPKIDFVDSQLLGAIYLLTSYKRIWKKFEGYIDKKDGINPIAFDKFEPKSDLERALVTAAYDLLYCTDCINLTDLTDKDTIPDGAFLAVCHAIGYVRYGFDNSSSESPIKELT